MYDKIANKSTTQIYLVPLSGGEPRQLTNDEHSSRVRGGRPTATSSPLFPRGTVKINLDNGRLQRSFEEINNALNGSRRSGLVGDGKWLAFASDVYPECLDDACNKRRADEVAAARSKLTWPLISCFVTGKAWKEGMRSHVFVVSSAGGDARDVTPGDTMRRLQPRWANDMRSRPTRKSSRCEQPQQS